MFKLWRTKIWPGWPLGLRIVSILYGLWTVQSLAQGLWTGSWGHMALGLVGLTFMAMVYFVFGKARQAYEESPPELRQRVRERREEDYQRVGFRQIVLTMLVTAPITLLNVWLLTKVGLLSMENPMATVMAALLSFGVVSYGVYQLAFKRRMM